MRTRDTRTSPVARASRPCEMRLGRQTIYGPLISAPSARAGRPCHGKRVAVALLAVVVSLAWSTSTALAQRRVEFPPAESKPPPPVKEPPRTISSGEDTSLLPDPGPSMRKTQERTPPPPTNLT